MVCLRGISAHHAGSESRSAGSVNDAVVVQASVRNESDAVDRLRVEEIWAGVVAGAGGAAWLSASPVR